MNIIFYTTDCPKCKVLKKKLENKNIKYILVDDQYKMKEQGITSVPALQIDGKIMFFEESVKYVNSL